MTMTPAPVDQLSPSERQRFERLKRTVTSAIRAVGRISGEALATIRDERLYRETHRSFEDFVLDEYGFSRATAYRMIEAANEAANGRALGVGERKAAGQRVSGETSPRSAPGRPDSPFRDPEPAREAPEPPAMPVDAGRLWATVTDSGGGEVRLVIDREAEEYPPAGAKVLVAWER